MVSYGVCIDVDTLNWYSVLHYVDYVLIDDKQFPCKYKT